MDNINDNKRTMLKALFMLLISLIAYLCLWPVPIDPVAWQAPVAPGYTGIHSANTRLRDPQMISLGAERGPEHIVLDSGGKLYTGVASGHVLRMNPDGSSQEVFSDTGGRPLGLAFDANNNLIVADAIKGLLSVSPLGKVSLLADTVEGKPIRFANAVTIASNGKIFLTDSSTRFSPSNGKGTEEPAMLDVMEQSSTGRVLEYTPADKAVRVVAKGLSFANGIALSTDERSLLVSESGNYRVWKISVEANQLDVAQPSAEARVLLDNLPGYPDNLTRSPDGKLWLGLAGQRNDLDNMAQTPFLRRLLVRIPQILWPQPKPFGHVIAFTEAGDIVTDLQDPSGASPLTTGVTETKERLYIHNANGSGLGWIPK